MNVMALAGPEIAVGVCVVEVTDVTYSRNLRRGIKRGSKITSDLENFLDRSSWPAFGAGAKRERADCPSDGRQQGSDVRKRRRPNLPAEVPGLSSARKHRPDVAPDV